MTTKTTTIIVVRHGETLWNVQSRYQGHGDSPLTAVGRAQAEATGKRLATLQVDVMIASDLGRTQETAAIIANSTGHRFAVDARLRERSFGVLEGLTSEEIRSAHPEAFSRLAENDPDFVIPGGESLRQHFDRNVDFIEDCIQQYAGLTVALVAHGGVLDTMFRYVTGIPLDQPRCFITSNASISIFRCGIFYDRLRWVLELWGGTSHLAGIGSRSDY